MPTLDIPATVVSTGGMTAVGGALNAVSTNDGDTSYLDRARAGGGSFVGYNLDVNFPATPIPGTVVSTSLVTVAKGTDSRQAAGEAGSRLLVTDASTHNTHLWNPIMPLSSANWTETVTPLTENGVEYVTQAMLESGTFEYNTGYALINDGSSTGVWHTYFTYIALRVTYDVVTPPTPPTPPPVQPVLIGAPPDPDELYANFRPVRYRYVMTYLHDTMELFNNGVETVQVARKAGEVWDVLPLTAVSYKVALYTGTVLNANVYLPDFYLDDMPHPPVGTFDRRRHPYQEGAPIGSMFECGNRAIYVMRNDEVVWGGILWTREYSSGASTMAITAMSFDAYAYYRLIRQTLAFNAPINIYSIWYACLKQMLTDFTWPGVDTGKKDSHGREIYKNSGMDGTDAHRHAHGEAELDQRVQWTGLTRSWKNAAGKLIKHSNASARNFHEAWPYNTPNIELPRPGLHWNRGTTAVIGTKVFHGYDMAKFGEALQQWADTETLLSPHTASGVSRFEYRVVCWFDQSQQIFRQRYVFGEMTPASTSTHDNPDMNGIASPLIGNVSRSEAENPATAIVFDFPGHIAEWSLSETMEEAATRVIAISGESDANKHTVYAVQDDLLKVPTAATTAHQIGSQGWVLYDQTVASNATKVETVLDKLKNLANKYLRVAHVPQAVSLDDLPGSNPRKNAHASHRGTVLSVALYQDPNTVFPDWTLGDWVTCAIEDPFYGGKMYVIRRIVGYTVTVLPDQESDYSHERIELDLTDDTKLEVS